VAQSLTVTINLPDAEATDVLGERLAASLPAADTPCVILLQGELGAGKSTLARSLIRSLGHTGTVPSPTYTLLEPYKISGRRVYHADLYRIGDPEELEYLGWSDLQDALLLVEWPERAPGLLQAADLKIKIGFDGEGRIASLESLSPCGDAILAHSSGWN
jgi:tRNA threonylcarbamoyladenosine biosynthesis protein TsaE